MNNHFIYDVEIYPNMFMVTFIPADVSQALIDVYVNIDIKLLAYKHKEYDEEFSSLVNDKNKVLEAMRVRQFIIWLDYKTGTWRNDAPLLMDFFIQHKTLTGYNSNNYDQYMIDIFINNYKYCDNRGFNKKEGKHITQILFNHSCDCIRFGNGYGRVLNFKKYYKRPFTDYDIQKILYLDKTFTSLKQVAICLKWYRIQNLPIPFDKPIKKEEIIDILDYNVNDVLITLTLVRNQKKEIVLREAISEKFGIDVRNMSRSSIGKAITTELYEKFSGIPRKDFVNTKTDRWKVSLASILSDKIRFETTILNNILDKVRKSTVVVGSDKDEDKFKLEFKFGNTIYTMALGGLHSQDQPGIFEAKEYAIRDADVASFYPNGILSYDVCPAHLERNPFRATVGYTKDTRVESKHKAGSLGKDAKKVLNDIHDAEAQHRNINEINLLKEKYNNLHTESESYKTEAEGLKIAINRMYGAFRDVNDYLYDPKCTYKVTVNLQLCLLMLIEKLELCGIEVISANTDGIVCIVYPHQEEEYKQCCDWWQDYNKFELEFTDYEKYLRNDVNNYIAIKKGFKDAYDRLIDKSEANLKEIEDAYIKRKGLFIEEIAFNKGYNYPVVPKALNLFFIYGIPYETTIENHIKSNKFAIYDYCMSQKTDAKFTIIYQHIVNGKVIEEELQKSNRFYITNISNGSGTIIKRDKAKNRTGRIIAKYAVKPFNDYFESSDYLLDLGFYKRECAKILYGKNKKTEGMIALQGDLFGRIDNPNLEKCETNNEILEVNFDDSDFVDRTQISKHIVTHDQWTLAGYAAEEDYVKDMKYLQEQNERLNSAPQIDMSSEVWSGTDLPF